MEHHAVVHGASRLSGGCAHQPPPHVTDLVIPLSALFETVEPVRVDAEVTEGFLEAHVLHTSEEAWALVHVLPSLGGAAHEHVRRGIATRG